METKKIKKRVNDDGKKQKRPKKVAEPMDEAKIKNMVNKSLCISAVNK